MIYLVRHGESTWNAGRRTQGQLPHPALTPTGRSQAARAARLIIEDAAGEAAPIRRMASSDLVRAQETAQVIGAALGLTAIDEPRLREQALGALEGMSYVDAAASVAGLDLTDPDVRPGGGESLREVHRRISAVLADYRGADAVLISHGDAIRVGLAAWAGREPADVPWRTVLSGAVFALSDDGTDRELSDDRAHQGDGDPDLDHGAEHVS